MLNCKSKKKWDATVYQTGEKVKQDGAKVRRGARKVGG